MRIVVLVKEVPDTFGSRRLSLETGLLERTGGDAVLDEIGERAAEVALSYADDHQDTEVVVVSMAPEQAVATMRKCLAMGASSVVHVVDGALVGADLGLTAEVLAAAVRDAGFDLVVTGNLSTDGSGGVLPAMLAELLAVPHLTALTSVEIGADVVQGTRATDGGTMRVSAALPAVISITEALPAGRFPTFKGIMAAKKKPVRQVNLTDLSVTADDPLAARSIVIAVAEKPPREAGVKVIDDGNAGAKLADYLVSNRLV